MFIHGYSCFDDKVRHNLSCPLEGCLTLRRYTVLNPSPQGLDYARQARRLVDIDDPSIEGLQTLLLLSQTFFAHGYGRKAYMALSKHPSPSILAP